MNLDVTRRRFSGGALASMAAMPVASKTRAVENWPTRLQSALEAMSTSGRTLRLKAFRLDVAQRPELSAVIELSWPYGTRSRRFFASQDTEDDTADVLLSQVQDAFAQL